MTLQLILTKSQDAGAFEIHESHSLYILPLLCCRIPRTSICSIKARKKAEKTVDESCKSAKQKKPRMYRKRARKDYLRVSKSKKRSQNVFWRTKSIETAKHWPFAKSMGSVCPAPLWVSPPKSAPLTPSKEAGISGRLRPQCHRGYFQDRKDRLWLGTHHSPSARDYFLVIGVALLLLSLSRSLRVVLALFCLLSLVTILPRLWSRAYIAKGKAFPGRCFTGWQGNWIKIVIAVLLFVKQSAAIFLT